LERDEILLDFGSPVSDFKIPESVTSACVCVAVARLAACEADPRASAEVNVRQTLALIDILARRGVYTLFLSSNQVFSGCTAHTPPGAPLSPVSEYGRQKAEVERNLQERMTAGAPIGVLRLAKVVSPGMPLVKTWIAQLTAGRPINAFTDMTMAPVPVDIVAKSITHMMQDRLSIIAQLSGPRDVAYSEIGNFLAKRLGVDPNLVRHVSARESGMPEGATPSHTTLDSSYILERYGHAVPDAFDVIEKL
jgi:dTDP-4-dehydrorhamnose reductase